MGSQASPASPHGTEWNHRCRCRESVVHRDRDATGGDHSAAVRLDTCGYFQLDIWAPVSDLQDGSNGAIATSDPSQRDRATLASGFIRILGCGGSGPSPTPSPTSTPTPTPTGSVQPRPPEPHSFDRPGRGVLGLSTRAPERVGVTAASWSWEPFCSASDCCSCSPRAGAPRRVLACRGWTSEEVRPTWRSATTCERSGAGFGCPSPCPAGSPDHGGILEMQPSRYEATPR